MKTIKVGDNVLIVSVPKSISKLFSVIGTIGTVTEKHEGVLPLRIEFDNGEDYYFEPENILAINRFNRQEFDKQINQQEFDNFLNTCKISVSGKDGFYTRNDAFKSGVMIAYHLLRNN